jgi:hypothetical protein
MTKPTMTSQWDPGSYKPLDMNKIPGYPRQMPPISKRWFPKFTGGNEKDAAFHMREFYHYFALNRVDDDAEDVVMKLFSKTLHGDAKKWYDNLPDAGITSMDQFEEIFLEEWGIHSEDIPLLIKNFEDIKQRENETLFDFQSRFEGTLCRIPKSHYPEMEYVVHRYTHAILPYLGVSLRKRAPRTLNDAYGMAKEIKNNIFSSGMNDLFTSGTLTMESLYSHEDLVDDFQEEGKQTVIQHEMNEDIDEEQEPEKDDEVSTCAPPTDEVMHEPVSPTQQSEEEVSHLPFQDANDTVYSEDEEEMEASDEVKVPCYEIKDEEAVLEDEVPVIIPHPDEALQDPITPAQDEENEVSYFSFDDALFYDSESKEGMEPLDEPDSLYLQTEDVEEDLSSDDDIQILEALAQEGLSEVHCSPFQVLNGYLPYDAKSEKVLDVLTPPCYDTDTDIADFDEFIHVGRRRWDTIGYDTDPIYDTKNHLQTLPLQLPQRISFDQWQQGDEVFTCSFQNTKDDPVPYLSDEFQSYLEMFDEYPTEHLDPTYEDDCQPLLCSNLNTSKDIVCLKEITHDFPSQPPVISLPGFSIQGVIGEYLFRVEFPPGQTLDFKGWLGNTISNQFFNLLLMIFQPSTKLLSILPLECENVLGNQFTCPLSCFAEPSMFYDPFSDRIECFSQRWTWRDFVPPTRLHELEFGTPDDVIYVLTHDVFVLDFSLFWFMMKHKGRYQGALLDWLHWLFDYTNMQPTGKYR